jgi:hypothetical protein
VQRRDPPRDLWADVDDVAVDEGVVGGFLIARQEPVAAADRRADQHQGRKHRDRPLPAWPPGCNLGRFGCGRVLRPAARAAVALATRIFRLDQR